jgi:hypothetical protein
MRLLCALLAVCGPLASEPLPGGGRLTLDPSETEAARVPATSSAASLAAGGVRACAERARTGRASPDQRRPDRSRHAPRTRRALRRDRSARAAGDRPPQIHIWRLEDGKVLEHWSVRDDLGQALQVGLIGR